jgi:omega-6 fatty acid desaturase (delta-12 desaturase)
MAASGGQPDWHTRLAAFERPDARRALGQVANTVLPLFVLVGLLLALAARGVPYGVIFTLSVVASALLTRAFILLHDASHGSFFPWPAANAVLGFVIGLFTLVPYEQWRWSHLVHHASFANLDRRGIGDIKLLTVDEYRAASPWDRLVYRIYRHPLTLFGIGPAVLFGLIYRFPLRGAPPHARRSVWLADLTLLALGTAAHATIGLLPVLGALAPMWLLAWTGGVWLFYMQHQFQGVYWARQEQWDYFRAALAGSSHYALPPLLVWITAHIGLHHLHHARPRIPNYHLQQAYDATPEVHVAPLTPRASLRMVRLRLLDEATGRMVGFDEVS